MKTHNLTLALSLAHLGYSVAYAPGDKPGWKKDADGKIVVDNDGNPIYVNSEGHELALGADTVSRLNGEAAGHRQRADKAEKDLKAYEGIDAKAAREALDTVKNLKDGDLIKAGEAERVRKEATALLEAQIAERDTKIADATGALTKLRLENAFSGSQYIKDQIAVPAPLLQSYFSNSFKDEDGKVYAVDATGQKMMSRKKAGDYADFDEAMQILVESSPFKDNLLKSGGSGSGSGGAGGSRNGTRVVRRADFDKMSPAEQQSIGQKQAKGELSIVD